eukprot:GHVU01086193.1.p3 GENE.GHVU01086193.1~~GHVU01086193.1.p3  ORF type:complete len:125 (+),score=9.93 GHVU01086193.1:236-610(+)
MSSPSTSPSLLDVPSSKASNTLSPSPLNASPASSLSPPFLRFLLSPALAFLFAAGACLYLITKSSSVSSSAAAGVPHRTRVYAHTDGVPGDERTATKANCGASQASSQADTNNRGTRERGCKCN